MKPVAEMDYFMCMQEIVQNVIFRVYPGYMIAIIALLRLKSELFCNHFEIYSAKKIRFIKI